MTKRVLSFLLALAMLLGLVTIAPTHAHAAGNMQASDALINYLKRIEGFAAIPYWDHAQWTVGFGSRCPEEHRDRYTKEGIPMEEAHTLLVTKINGYASVINDFVEREGLSLKQHQFDALISFTYNLGTAWMSDKNSNIRIAVVEGHTGNGFLGAISAYCNASGEFMGGLLRRRLTEGNMYLNGVYGQYAPSNYAYIRYDACGGKMGVNTQGYDCHLYAAPSAIPTRDGYVFQGWYTEAEGGLRITELDENTDGMTLYAHWAEKVSGATVLPGGGVSVSVTGIRVNVRSGPGMSYSVVDSVYQGDVLNITQIKEVGGAVWGMFEEGWISLSYTTYKHTGGSTEPEEPSQDDDPLPKLPATGTVVGTDSLRVYNGPHTTYPKVGTLKEGDKIVIVETYNMFGTIWGRYEGGWVKMDDNLLFDNYPQLAHSFIATVTNSTLNVRSGPSTSYTKLGTVTKGTKLEVTSILTINGNVWGRHEAGWSQLTSYTDVNPDKFSQYREHSLGTWYPAGDPTCQAQGQERRDCKYCDYYETRLTGFADHVFGSWKPLQEGNCVTPGQEQRVCTVCGLKEIRDTQLGSHSFGQWETVTASTCTVKGQERRNCQFCDHFETREMELAAHTYTDWFVSKEPTTTEAGEERRDCVDCDHFETKPIAPSEHSFGEWEVFRAPTCTEKGEVRRKCTHCEMYESQEVAATGHAFSEWVRAQEPTCQADGLETRICTNCALIETNPIPKIDHVFGEWAITTAPTCQSEGVMTRKCKTCDLAVTDAIAMVDHEYGAWRVTVEPTCSAEGEQKRKCKNCDHMETAAVEKTEHTFTDWSFVTKPTCLETGEAQRSCTVCGFVQLRPVDTVEHTFSDWALVRDPACGLPGEEARTCSVCQTAEYRPTEALEHNYGEWFTFIETSCAAPGEKRRVCSICNGYETEEIPALAHTLGSWKPHVAATCTQVGESRRTCANCAFYESRVLPKADHVMGDWKVHVSPTCTEDGQARQTCVNCDYFITDRIVKTGHKLGEWVVVKEPTCTEEGESRQSCEYCDYYESKILPVKTGQTVIKTYAVITCDALSIRAGAGTNYTRLGYLYLGDRVEILESTAVGSYTWGRTEKGWICLTGYTTLEFVEENVDTPTVVTKIFGTLTGNDYLNIRAGIGTNYALVGKLYRGDRVEILEQREVNGYNWGRIAEGWIRLTGYMTLETVTETVDPENPEEPKPPVEDPDPPTVEPVLKTYGVLTGNDFLNIRAGAGTSYALVGKLYKGDRVEILEQKMIGTKLWGRIAEGWIQLTGYMTLEEVEENTGSDNPQPPVVETVTKTYGTLTGNSFLRIRAGAGTSYAQVGQLAKGDRVEILEKKVVGNNTWGRIAEGWIQLTGYMTLETVEEPV